MSYFLTTLLSYLLLYKYSALFLIVFSSAIIFPWPQNTLLLAAGAFASQGYFSITLCFIVAQIANVLGDITGYILTRTWGYRIIKEKHIKKFSSVAKLDRYMRNYAGLTIVATRFIGTLGSLVNFLAGLAHVPFLTFIIYDCIGNALDIGLFLYAGYALGTLWQSFSGIANTASWIIAIIIAIFFIIKAFISKKHTKTTPDNVISA